MENDTRDKLPATKICRICGKEYDNRFFYRYRTECKKCTGAKQKEIYIKKRADADYIENHNAKIRKYRDDPEVHRQRVEYQREYSRRSRRTVRGWCSNACKEANKRAKKRKIPHTITRQDVESVFPVNMVCPVLSTKMCFGDSASLDGVSLDRIVPGKGYVPGNIAVVSRRANAIKLDATADELQKVTDWVRSKTRTHYDPFTWVG